MSPEPAPPPVLAVVVTFNGLADTRRSLDALLQQAYPALEIHVVDNGSTDGTPQTIAADYPSVRLHPLSHNLGFAAACNIGLRRARERGAYALLLNNDTDFDPTLVARLVARAEAEPTIGLLAPLILYESPADRIWASGFRRHPVTLETTGGHRGQPARGQVDPATDWDYLLGCALLVRPEVLERVGLLDEQFFFTYEDLDYSIRTQRAGFHLRCEPTARLVHRVSATAGEDSALQNFYLGEASVRFFAKHAPLWARPLILLNRLGSAGRRVLRLLRQRRADTARAYLRGVAHGWRGRAGAGR